MSLPAILEQAQAIDGGFTVSIPPEWLQGRTAYGGLSAALAYEAARIIAPDLPPLRSVQVSFVGPLAGPVTVTAKLLRRGRNAAFVQSEVCGEHGIGLTATFVFMRERESVIELKAKDSAPDYPRPAAIEIPAGLAPAFISMFEIGPLDPMPGGGPADIVRWFRLKHREGLNPMTELILMGDGVPPAALMLTNSRIPLSSLTWIYNVLAPNPVTEDGWWLLRATSDHVQHGSTSQDMSVWNAKGELVARGMQSIALFG